MIIDFKYISTFAQNKTNIPMKRIVLLLMVVLAVGCSKNEEKPNYSEISGAYSKDFGTGNGNIWLWIQSSGNFELKSTYASGKESVFKGRIIKKDGDSYSFEIENGRRVNSDLPAKGDVFECLYWETNKEMSITYDGANIRYERLTLQTKYK